MQRENFLGRIISGYYFGFIGMLLFFLSPIAIKAQANAGKDKVICKGSTAGVRIGGYRCAGCCYSWSPTTDLDNPNILNPIAKPTKTTIYTLTVVGPNFKFKETDEVEIRIVDNGTATSSVASGAIPSPPFDPNEYGFVIPVRVDVDITACLDGPDWKVIVTSITGNYSKRVRLVPGVDQVTGPNGNTSNTNFCNQIIDLKTLGEEGIGWYMIEAVEAHERVHEVKFDPALNSVKAVIEAEFEKLSVPNFNQSQRAAIATIKSSPGFTAAKNKALLLWNGEFQILVSDDHLPGGATDNAELGVVTPMINRICTHAKNNSWPLVCAPCQP